MAQPHLPDLLIEGYRGIRRLELKKLGNVNLFVGRNGVGKTSVLEAVRLYSSQGAFAVFSELIDNRGERSRPPTSSSLFTPSEVGALFYNRPDIRTAKAIVLVGPSADPCSIEFTFTARQVRSDGSIAYSVSANNGDSTQKPRIPTIIVQQHGGIVRTAPMFPPVPLMEFIDETLLPDSGDNPPHLYVGSHGLRAIEIGKLWDMIVLTEREDLLTTSLREVNAGIQRISMIDDSSGARRVMAKMAGSDRPVPVQSLGDGAMRFLGIGAAIVNARNGFLLIDEFENGLHFTTQEALWKFVIRMARELNVQVFATTHSQDCINSFGRAAAADPQSEGIMFRLENFRGEVVETHFEESSIVRISETLIEVR